MAVIEQPAPAPALYATAVADPAPLGLAAFALTTFLLSGHNASLIPDAIWLGPALFYGGLAQLLAGMWEFRNRNVFGATAFATYGGFWLGLGIVVVLAGCRSFARASTGTNLPNGLAWFLLAFAIFNPYMLLWSTRVNVSVFLVFLTLRSRRSCSRSASSTRRTATRVVAHVGGWIGSSPPRSPGTPRRPAS